MAVKTLVDSAGKNRRLGRNRPTPENLGRALHFGRYVTGNLPAPPSEAHYAPAAMPALNEMYGNDLLGDCVIAALAHVEGVWSYNAGDGFIYTYNGPNTRSEIVSAYSAIGGYVPDEPSTDQGCDEITALNYWQKTGLSHGSVPHKILGWIAVDATNVTEFHQALWLFENLLCTGALPDAWVNPSPSASFWTWKVAGAPDPNNGHAWSAMGYYPQYLRVATWGMQGQLTNAALAKYCVPSAAGGLYTAIGADALNRATQRAPNGLNWTQLQQDFTYMQQAG